MLGIWLIIQQYLLYYLTEHEGCDAAVFIDAVVNLIIDETLKSTVYEHIKWYRTGECN